MIHSLVIAGIALVLAGRRHACIRLGNAGCAAANADAAGIRHVTR